MLGKKISDDNNQIGSVSGRSDPLSPNNSN